MTAIDPEGSMHQPPPKWGIDSAGNLTMNGEPFLSVHELEGDDAEWMEQLVAQANASAAPETAVLRFIFDGPPGPQCGRLVEVEDGHRRSVKAGEWREEAPYWVLYVPTTNAPASPAVAPQAGAISDEELRQVCREAIRWWADETAPYETLPLSMPNEMAHGYAQGVVTERKRSRANVASHQTIAADLRRQVRELRDRVEAAPAASPAGGGAAGLVRELLVKLRAAESHARLAAMFLKDDGREEWQEIRAFADSLDGVLARAAAFVDHAPALAAALKRARSTAEIRADLTHRVYGGNRPHESWVDEADDALAAYDAATSTAKPATDSPSGEGGGK